MKKIFIFLSLAITLLFLFKATILSGQSPKAEYEEAVKSAKEKKADFAFMAFRSIIRNFPETEYARESTFAVGEYYYQIKAYYDAIKYFNEYLKKYPAAPGATFAKAYLLKIKQDIKKPTERQKEIIDEIEMDFFSRPLFLVFSEYKEVSYKSAFQNEFAIRYQLDMIEIHRNGKIFIKITK